MRVVKKLHAQYCSAILRKYAHFCMKRCSINKEMNLLKVKVSVLNSSMSKVIKHLFRKNDKILIKLLRQEKVYTKRRNMSRNFPTETGFCRLLMKKFDQTYTVDRKPGSGDTHSSKCSMALPNSLPLNPCHEYGILCLSVRVPGCQKLQMTA